jgi:hypothetical protein
MVDANLRILINAVDKASPQLKGITGALSGIAGSVAPMAIAGAAITAVADFTRRAVEETQAYNLEMVDLARKMGTTTEEASRLVQVGDDLRISQAAISQAMTFAIRNGIEPSINGIAKLADEYNALKDPVAKGQLLLKSFGRSGLEMGKLLEQGGQGIKNMAQGIGDGLIVTEQAAEASKRYYEQVDALNDSWTEFKMIVGNAVIPALTDILDGEQKITDATWENVRAMEAGMAQQKAYGVSTAATAAQIDKMKTSLSQAADAARWTALANTFVTEVNPALASLDFNALTATTAMQGLTAQLIYQQASAGLTAEQSLVLAESMGLIDSETVATMATLNNLRGELTAGRGDMELYAAQARVLSDAIGSIKSKTVTVTVNYAGGFVNMNGMNVATLGGIPEPTYPGSSGGGMP